MRGNSHAAALSARIGIATGRVMIHQKEGDHYGENVIGACLNKAARLQAIAIENTAVVCGITRKLVGKAFDFEDLGPKQLKGFEQPESVYRLKARRRKSLSRFEAFRGERRMPLVGRDNELGYSPRASLRGCQRSRRRRSPVRSARDRKVQAHRGVAQ